MRIVTLGINGVTDAVPSVVAGSRGRYCAFVHGERGRGRWEYILPLNVRHFPPVLNDRGEYTGAPYAGLEFELVKLEHQDDAGNQQYILRRGRASEDWLILWHLSPGFRGSATYSLSGAAKLLAKGREAQGLAGRMGGADCPIILVEGDAALHWSRDGRLYGTPANWVALYQNGAWTVRPTDTALLEDAVFS